MANRRNPVSSVHEFSLQPFRPDAHLLDRSVVLWVDSKYKLLGGEALKDRRPFALQIRGVRKFRKRADIFG
jgi:hypothetical protein